MVTPSLIVMPVALLLYYQFFRRCQGKQKGELQEKREEMEDKKKGGQMTALLATDFT